MIEINGKTFNAYKAALHTHSTNSDGKYTPAEVIDIYREHGYDVLAFTDHRFVTKIAGLDGKGMTLIQSLEMHPMGPRGRLWHLVALNVSDDFVYDESIGAQALIDRAVSCGAMAIYAHPYWCGFTSDEVASLKNISAIEVYNTSCRYIGKQFNMQLWDELSDKGYYYPALAVDDMHHAPDQFRGWTVIAAEDKSVPSVMAALKAGRFYASMGPEITRISFKDNIFEASFSPCKEVIALSNFSLGFCVEVEDLKGYGTGTTLRTECRIKIPPLPDKQRWFRLQIKDEAGRYAWTAPIVLPPAP